MPVTIIGGYLGSGKTTLVNHLLRHANGVQLAVMVNDFGELPIDADLIESQHGDVISLSGGCVCCSYGDDLSAALLRLQSVSEQPDHIIIEASGVALPGAIGKTLSLHRNFQLEGIVVIADASTITEHANARYIGDTIDRQLLDADLIVLNKLDLLDEGQVVFVRGWLAGKYSHAPEIVTTYSKLEPSVIFSVGDGAAPGKLSSGTIVKSDTTSISNLSATAEHTHHASQFTSFHLDVKEKINAQEIAAKLAGKQCDLVRAKGFVMDLDNCMKTIQVVGRRWSVTAAPENVKAGVVCIGLSGELSEQRVRAFAEQV